jgi:integrase
MVESGKLSRKVINRRVNRIRRMFKWAVSEELCPTGTYEALRAVSALEQGRTTAHEAPPVEAVPQGFVDPVVEAACPQIAAMIQLQQLGAMRPAEVTALRACEIDMTRDIWLYQPYSHKNRWRGKDRAPIFLGPQAQAIIRPFLKPSTEAYLFSPIEAEEQRNAQRKKNRKSPMTPSQSRRIAKKNPKRAKLERYDTDSYRRAIQYTIQRVNRERQKRGEVEIPKWCPLQLRHRSATDIRSKFGIEAAQVFLGHEHADVTQVYAERDLEAGIRIARDLG